MVAIPDGSLVLVTGASGFISVWVCKILLEHGYKVRATVKSNRKGDYLAELFEEHPRKFSYVVVKDVGKQGAFDAAVKDVDAVCHMSTPPMNTQGADPFADLIEPMVRAVQSILNSVNIHGTKVKRVVIPSSVATLLDPKLQVPYLYTEIDWNEYAVNTVTDLGIEAEPIIKIRAAKTLAEMAAWEYMKERSNLHFDLVTLIPPYTFGPILNEVSSPDQLNPSVKWFYDEIVKLATDPSKNIPAEFVIPMANFADVRDVARAHMEVLRQDKAGGERYIIARQPFCIQDFLDAINSFDPPLTTLTFPPGTPGGGSEVVYPRVAFGGKSRTELNFEYSDFRDTVRDTLLSLKDMGWAGDPNYEAGAVTDDEEME